MGLSEKIGKPFLRLITSDGISKPKSSQAFDFALRLANALEIDINEICSAGPFSGVITEEKIYSALPDGLNGALDSSRIKI